MPSAHSKKLGSVGSWDERDCPLSEPLFWGILSLHCAMCAEGLFRRAACSIPGQNPWVTGRAPSEGSSVVTWAPCSTSPASSVRVLPCRELSRCSPFLAGCSRANLRMRLPSSVTSSYYQGGVLKFIIISSTVETIFW